MTTRNHDGEKVVTTQSGARASECHDYTAIPLSTLNALARRQELGAKKHGRDNWRQGLGDPEYVKARLSHVIRHAFTLAAKLDGRQPWDGDDDLGAILWGGMFLAEAQAVSPAMFEAPEEAGPTPEDRFHEALKASMGRMAQEIQEEAKARVVGVDLAGDTPDHSAFVIHRAGGCVLPRRPYIVADNGPEVFLPSAARVKPYAVSGAEEVHAKAQDARLAREIQEAAVAAANRKPVVLRVFEGDELLEVRVGQRSFVVGSVYARPGGTTVRFEGRAFGGSRLKFRDLIDGETFTRDPNHLDDLEPDEPTRTA